MQSSEGQIVWVMLPSLAVEFPLVPTGHTCPKSKSVECELLASIH
jgi:hypothetical protein